MNNLLLSLKFFKETGAIFKNGVDTIICSIQKNSILKITSGLFANLIHLRNYINIVKLIVDINWKLSSFFIQKKQEFLFFFL
jgi:hypothetical protein